MGRAVALVAVASRAAGAGSAAKLPFRSSPPLRLPFVAQTRGPNDPHELDLSLLIPRGTRLRQVWFIHGGRKRDQVLVEWVRSRRVSVYAGDFGDDVRWGLTLWTQAPARLSYQAPWKGVALPLLKLAPGAPNMRLALEDVTGDRHPDVLLEPRAEAAAPLDVPRLRRRVRPRRRRPLTAAAQALDR